ncbi:uncharacterized protein FIBRA_02230 [Fibroporia radiculosa]|uniref:Uncharacterized protein n=1 Tax=Fibroporia radiculosa TaxID=599839 RepID=J4HUK5_9APHY|nr:uncharacterized protein FIBRA_02230 [Fibroporia radiculosa]CCM00202.1 predicted protein [Fibroporia radiculosa]
MYNPLRPPPKPPAFATGSNASLPEERASPWSRLVFSWLDPLLMVGFSRPLQTDDLWTLPNKYLASQLSDKVERNFFERCPPEQRPAFMQPRHNDDCTTSRESPSDIEMSAGEEAKLPQYESGPNYDQWARWIPGYGLKTNRSGEIKYDSSLLYALHTTFFWKWWAAGILTLIANTLNTCTPLVSQVLLTWLTDSYTYHRTSIEQREGLIPPQGIGYGIGLSFGLFLMQEISSIITAHYSLMTMQTGFEMRTATIGTIFRKSLRLSGRARLKHSSGQITTMIATDTTRLERVTIQAHNLWVAPLQIAIGMGLLIDQLGYSALVGLAVLVFGFPVQMVCTRIMFDHRLAGLRITDQRIRVVGEILQGIRLIKYYAWERFYTDQVYHVRQRELSHVRKLSIARAALLAMVTAIPVVAAILSFITYALSGHNLTVSTVFTALQFLNIIRTPIRNVPLILQASTDAIVALRRISNFLVAEEIPEPYVLDPESKFAVDVDGDFVWETSNTTGDGSEKKDKSRAYVAEKKSTSHKRTHSFFKLKPKKPDGSFPATAYGGDKEEQGSEKPAEEEKPFALKNLRFQVPHGSFVAIVGSIGSGKSSLLHALIGEMRRTRGQVVVSSRIAFAPQTPWIMHASVRENITFGQPEDEKRLKEIYHACCLEEDLEMFPQGQDTEIGEKGINLSGGQKARVSLARAAYSGSEIVLMDDSLSAVDAHVGKTLVDSCLVKGPLAGKTRILVTHALHMLDKTDYVYVMDNGAIAEQGTFNDLMNKGAVFSRLMEEFGNQRREEVEITAKIESNIITVPKSEGEKQTRPKVALMQAEERLTGAVSLKVYDNYLRAAGGLWWILVLFINVVVYQGSQVANNLVLGWWTSESISGFTQGDYMALYAALGVGSGVGAFLLSMSFTVATLIAGLRLFKDALNSVLHSPVSFFDTTPMGRIMSRLSNDQNTLDLNLALTANQLLQTFSSVVGTVVLVFYTLPYLGTIFAPLLLLYLIAAMFYRRTSVETKRLDSIMRSMLYSAYTECLTGLSTVRSYRAQNRFVMQSDHGQDMENRAYYMTIAIQQWLSIRLDTLGNLLVLGIALFASGIRTTIDPSSIGVVLSYTLSGEFWYFNNVFRKAAYSAPSTVTEVLSSLIQTYAQNEQNFNAVERVQYYTQLPSEGETTMPNDPSPAWPEQGRIRFENVELAYREGLPLVLKGVTFTVHPGEKIGIVGRTGAGKSSLLQALFRIVNTQGGIIEIDGYNIRDIGLDTLRGQLALVPQDALLFKGTLRQNLSMKGPPSDPQGIRADAELISALKRTWLLPRDGSCDPVVEAKFSLDSPVSEEGSNYSAGEKQLLALCRAVVKNSRIIVLDEATSNVDVQMDAKLQATIQMEFSSSTLLCIAHRLNTIVYYDKILVMDAGKVVEFDTPLTLYNQKDSIFRSLCDEANLSGEDIVRIRTSAQIY